MFCQQPKQTTLDCEFMDGKQWRATLILIAAKGYTCRDTPRARKISWLEAVNYYCAECRIRKVFLDLRSSEWPVQDCRYYRAGREDRSERRRTDQQPISCSVSCRQRI